MHHLVIPSSPPLFVTRLDILFQIFSEVFILVQHAQYLLMTQEGLNIYLLDRKLSHLVLAVNDEQHGLDGKVADKHHHNHPLHQTSLSCKM